MYTIVDALFAQAKYQGAGPALRDAGLTISYATFLERARMGAGVLQSLGVAQGGRVIVFVPRSHEAPLWLFAIWLAGAIAVPVSERLRGAQLSAIIDECAPCVVVTHSRLAAMVPETQQRLVVDTFTPPATSFIPRQVRSGHLACLLFTSGSSGTPKGVVVNHRTLLDGARIVSDYLSISSTDRLLGVLPLCFDYGLNQLVTSVLQGAVYVVQRSLFAPHIVKALADEEVTGLAGVPLLWSQLAGSTFSRMPLPRLRYLTNSGGSLVSALGEKLRVSRSGLDVWSMYGLTEAFRSTALPPSELTRRPTSIGLPIPDVEITIVSTEGTVCGVDEIGELLHRGPTTAQGYWRDEEATARVFRRLPAESGVIPETVVYSGDLASRDANGYLYFHGRRDQLMKARGVRFAPEEIERPLMETGLVTFAGVFGCPDQDGVTRIVAAIMSTDPISEGTLEALCRERLPGHLVPDQFWRVREVPTTSSGKIDRAALREAHSRRDDGDTIELR